MVHKSENYKRYEQTHHFYRDVLSFDYAIPAEIISGISTNAALMQKFAAIINSPHKPAQEILAKVNFGFSDNKEKGFKALLEAISLAPKKNDSIYGSEEYSEFRKNIPLLEKLATKCFAYSPEVADYRYTFALLLIKAGLISHAVENLYKALEINPDFVRANMVLGVIQTICEDWENGYINSEKAFLNKLETQRGNLVEISYFTCAYKKKLAANSRIRLDSQKQDFAYSLKDATAYFPEITGDLRYKNQETDVVFLPSDSNYFKKHSIAFACSVLATNPGVAIHFHIANPDEEDFQIIEQFKKIPASEIYLTTEQLNFDNYMNSLYYLSAIRDVRLFQMAQENSNRIIRFDVDGLMVNNIKTAGYAAKNFIVAANNKISMPFWEYIPNGLKIIKRDDVSMKIMSELVMLLFDNFYHKTHLWFSDQIYINILFEKYKDNIATVETSENLDLIHNDGSFVWMVTHDKEKSEKYKNKKLEFLKKYNLEKYYA